MAKTKAKYQLENIEVGELMPRCSLLKSGGWRLCQIHCVRTPGGYELTYSLAWEYDLMNFKLTIPEDGEVPSVTPIYACAWMYENEIAELFGVNITNILRNYEKKLYKIHIETPFK